MPRIIDRATSGPEREESQNVRPDQPEDWGKRGRDMDKYLGDISPKPKRKKP